MTIACQTSARVLPAAQLGRAHFSITGGMNGMRALPAATRTQHCSTDKRHAARAPHRCTSPTLHQRGFFALLPLQPWIGDHPGRSFVGTFAPAHARNAG